MIGFSSKDGRRWRIWWEYNINPDSGRRDSTTCFVEQQPSVPGEVRWTPYSYITFLHEKDRDIKEFARKLTLTKALRVGQFSKDERRAAWEAYFLRK